MKGFRSRLSLAANRGGQLGKRPVTVYDCKTFLSQNEAEIDVDIFLDCVRSTLAAISASSLKTIGYINSVDWHFYCLPPRLFWCMVFDETVATQKVVIFLQPRGIFPLSELKYVLFFGYCIFCRVTQLKSLGYFARPLSSKFFFPLRTFELRLLRCYHLFASQRCFLTKRRGCCHPD